MGEKQRSAARRASDKANHMIEKKSTAAQDRIAPEEIVFDAMGAYEALAKHVLMKSRADGLTKTQTDIVMRLAFCGQCSMSSLATELAVSKEHVTRAINALVERGFVEKRRSSENFRVVQASLTARGSELSRAIRAASIERLRKRLEAASAKDREALLQASERATEIIFGILHP